MDNSRGSHQQAVSSDPLAETEEYLQCINQHIQALSTALGGCKNTLGPVGSNYRAWVDAYRGEVRRNHFRRQENRYLQDRARDMIAEIRNLRASNKQLINELNSLKQAQPSLAKAAQLEILVKQYERGMSSLHKRARDLESEKAILSERVTAAERSLRNLERELDESQHEQHF